MGVNSYILTEPQNTGVFSGLGKASLKLDFDTKDELNEYCARMLEASNPDDNGDDPERGDRYLLHTVRGLGETYDKETLWQALTATTETITPKVYKSEDFKNSFIYDGENDIYKTLTPLGYVYIRKQYLTKHLFLHRSTRLKFNLFVYTLQRPRFIFTTKDEHGNYRTAFVKAFNINGEGVICFIDGVNNENEIRTGFKPSKNVKNHIYNLYKKGGCNVLYPKNESTMPNSLGYPFRPITEFKIVEFRLPLIFTENNLKGLSAPGDVYIITDTRTKPRKELEETAAFKKFDIRPFDGSEFAADGSVVWFPVKDLNFDRANFQNREDDYSQDSVDKIIKAVKKGDFNWAVFDAVTIWQNPADGKFYVLSGHSRSEAFKRLAQQGATAQGKDFKRIPAKIFKGTLQEARQLALNSNTLSTKETNFERANYWRDVYERELEKQGGNRKAAENVVIQQIKETEGKNANSVFYISFLNKNGIFYDALRMLANAPTQDRERLKVVAEWVGHLRKDRPKLTNQHETELFNYLITEGNYNKAVTNYADLLKRIDTAIIKNTDDGKFDPSKALNLKKNIVV